MTIFKLEMNDAGAIMWFEGNMHICNDSTFWATWPCNNILQWKNCYFQQSSHWSCHGLSQIVLLMINQIWSALSFFKLMTINYFVVLVCDRKHFLYHLEWRNYSLQVSLNDARERRYRFDRIFPGQTTNREVCWEY